MYLTVQRQFGLPLFHGALSRRQFMIFVDISFGFLTLIKLFSQFFNSVLQIRVVSFFFCHHLSMSIDPVGHRYRFVHIHHRQLFDLPLYILILFSSILFYHIQLPLSLPIFINRRPDPVQLFLLPKHLQQLFLFSGTKKCYSFLITLQSFLFLASFMVTVGQVKHRQHVLWGQFQSCLVISFGLKIVFHLQVNYSSVIEGRSVLWINFDYSVKIRQSFTKSLQLTIHTSPIIQSMDVIWVNAQSVAKIIQCLLIPPQRFIGRSSVIVNLLRTTDCSLQLLTLSYFNALRIIGDSFFIHFFHTIDHSTIVVCQNISVVQVNHVGIVGNCKVVFVLGCIAQSSVYVGRFVQRMLADVFEKGGDGGSVIAALVAANAQIVIIHMVLNERIMQYICYLFAAS